VTGRPEPSAAARATATAVSGSRSSAAPAPVFSTLRTGQPMFRSTMSAPLSATSDAARLTGSGSGPNSCIETGCSSGWIRSISVCVRSFPW
jgi:hypothetical protein